MVEENWLPVHAAAADADGDVPQALHYPVPLGVRHQHLSLHLLAVVVLGAPAVLPCVVTQDLGYGFCIEYYDKTQS